MWYYHRTTTFATTTIICHIIILLHRIFMFHIVNLLAAIFLLRFSFCSLAHLSCAHVSEKPEKVLVSSNYLTCSLYLCMCISYRFRYNLVRFSKIETSKIRSTFTCCCETSNCEIKLKKSERKIFVKAFNSKQLRKSFLLLWLHWKTKLFNSFSLFMTNTNFIVNATAFFLFNTCWMGVVYMCKS